MEKICWTCGNYAFACFANDPVDHNVALDDTCNKWCPEGTRGTVTDVTDGVGSDDTTWAQNEYLQDNESNL